MVYDERMYDERKVARIQGLLSDGRLVVELSIEEDFGAAWACLEGYDVPEEVEAWEGMARGEKSRKATRALLL
jgi:hypothetical protein